MQTSGVNETSKVLASAAAIVQLTYMGAWTLRIVRGGRVLFKLSEASRWWRRAAFLCVVVSAVEIWYDAGRFYPQALILASTGAFFAAMGRGVQLRERGIAFGMEFVPWKRLDVSWTDTNELSVTVRRAWNWDSTSTFPVLADRQPGLAAILERVPASTIAAPNTN